MSLQRHWSTWRFIALLGFALMAPAGLPAGGSHYHLPEVRRRERESEPLISAACAILRCAPQHQAPVLIRLQSDIPLKVLREWLSSDGHHWLKVEAMSASGQAIRGWTKA